MVSPFQIGFILGRSIRDNIVVAQEMLHSMYIARGKQGYFVIKVDLAKAYDMVNWNFVRQVLIEIDILVNLIQVTVKSIEIVKTTVLLK